MQLIANKCQVLAVSICYILFFLLMVFYLQLYQTMILISKVDYENNESNNFYYMDDLF